MNYFVDEMFLRSNQDCPQFYHYFVLVLGPPIKYTKSKSTKHDISLHKPYIKNLYKNYFEKGGKSLSNMQSTQLYSQSIYCLYKTNAGGVVLPQLLFLTQLLYFIFLFYYLINTEMKK